MVSLEGIEVKAARRQLATVQELSGPALQALSSTSIADALKYFAGAQIKDYGGLGGLKTVNVRSLGAQHVGVFIDGVRISNAQNGTVDLGKYSLSTLESVSLYNANKLDFCQSPSEYSSGATVYMRTRRPVCDSITALAGMGSFGTWRGRATAEFARRGWSGFVDGEYLSTRGDYPFRYKSEYEDTVGRRRNSDIRYTRAEAALFKKGFSSHLYAYISERGCPGESCAASPTSSPTSAGSGTPTSSPRQATNMISTRATASKSMRDIPTSISATTPITLKTRTPRVSTTITISTTPISRSPMRRGR